MQFYFELKSKRGKKKKEYGQADGWEDADNMVCSDFILFLSHHSLSQDYTEAQHVKYYSKNIKTSSLQFITAAMREIGLRSCLNCELTKFRQTC